MFNNPYQTQYVSFVIVIFKTGLCWFTKTLLHYYIALSHLIVTIMLVAQQRNK